MPTITTDAANDTATAELDGPQASLDGPTASYHGPCVTTQGPGGAGMPVRDPGFAKDLVRRYLNDVFSRGDFSVIDHYLAGEKFTSGVADLVTRWRAAFPDLRIDVQDVIVEGDKVVTEEKMTGTHTGTYRSTSTGLIVDPTGREVTWTRLAVRTLRDDRFVDGFWEEDEVGLLQQLGVLEAPAANDLRD